MKYTFYFDAYDMDDKIAVGDAVIVVCYTYLNTGEEEYALYVDDNTGGIPGNTDSQIKRYHGWRGTTNNVSEWAHGVHTVKSIDLLKRGDDDIIKITINRTDIKKNEP